MAEILLSAGIVLQAVVWHLVSRGRLPFWETTAATFGALGLATVAVADVACCAAVPSVAAAAAGLAAGVALYGATRVVVGAATRWSPLREAVSEVYGRAEEASLAAVLALCFLTAAGEELFWRGLVQPELRAALSPIVGAALSWAGYAGANAASASLPLVAGALVGGALWTALGAWTEGVVAPIASHVVWTGLMVVWPPAAGRDRVAA